MSNEIILLNSISDFDIIPFKQIKKNKVKIFSFKLDVHRKLKSKNIEHEIAENLLDKNERMNIFDKGLEFLLWNSKIVSKDLQFEDTNLLKLFDTHEFHSYLMPNLIKFVLVKRIIEKEKPEKIIASSFFKKMIQSIVKENPIETKFYENNIETKLLWENITIKTNFLKIPIQFTLSKTNFLKIKKYVEIVIGKFQNVWLKLDKNKKAILLLEFNPELWGDLLNELKDYDGNIILINQRGSSLASKRSINLIKNSNIKVLNFHNFLTKDEEQKIDVLVAKYTRNINEFWKKNHSLEDFFQVEKCDFWNVIKDRIIASYHEKLPGFIKSILIAKKLFNNINIKCIVSLHEIGETEKTFLEYNKKKNPSILFDHGFVERVEETKRFDNLLYVNFKDIIALWGNIRKEYLIQEHKVLPDKILVTGSPKHDIYFRSKIKKRKTEKITVLLAPNPITEFSGLASTDLELRFESALEEIISVLKDFDVNIIVKLHQIQQEYNNNIRNIIQKIDKKITIFSTTSVIKTINQSDVVIVISSESFGTSTMLMESMILGKPTMNIVLDDEIPQYTHVKDNAVFTVSNNDNIKEKLQKIIFEKEFQEKIIQNADNFIEKFLENRGNASKKCASVLKSF